MITLSPSNNPGQCPCLKFTAMLAASLLPCKRLLDVDVLEVVTRCLCRPWFGRPRGDDTPRAGALLEARRAWDVQRAAGAEGADGQGYWEPPRQGHREPHGAFERPEQCSPRLTMRLSALTGQLVKMQM